MANEVTVSASVRFRKGKVNVELPKAGLQFDVAGSKFVNRVQTIGTSEEAIGLGDVGTVGWFIGVNNDKTNYLEIRPNTGVADLIRMEPGEPALFRLAQDAVPYAIANTAACDLEYVLIED